MKLFNRILPSLVLALPLVAPTSLFAQSKGPKLPDGVTAERDVAYGTHERQKLDVYVPKSEKPLPLVIWVHGGGWEAGTKDNNPALTLMARGFAVAGINYRLSQHAVFPAQIHDVKAAVRYLRANAKKLNLNADKFGAVGASAGGHLVALLGTSGSVKDLEGDGGHVGVSSKVQAVCDWFGPTDIAKMSPAGITGNPITKLLGGDTGSKATLAKAANPITHITKDVPPFLIIHGDKDPLVPLSQSELLHTALKDAKVSSDLWVIPGAAHGGKEFTAALTTGEHKNRIGDFFEKQLK
jgi:acetyl esterase/lipase